MRRWEDELSKAGKNAFPGKGTPLNQELARLKVSNSGYYDWRARRPSNRAQDNSRLLRCIHALHAKSDGVFGSPRMLDELHYEGETCSLNRVARLMKSAGLVGIPARTKWRKKASGKRPGNVSNHLQRNFTAQQANTKWVTDITYIRTAEGWLYLAVVIDLYSRLVIGWSMSSRWKKS